MKQYAKYFKTGQKIQLRVLDSTNGLREVLTVFFHDHDHGTIDLILPYKNQEGEEYPFLPNMPLELSSDALGMGIRMNVAFQGYTARKDVIRVEVTGELQIFQRRTQRRIDTLAGLRFTRGQGTLRTFREQWRKNVEILQKTNPATLPAFPEAQINLSNGGIRLIIKPPIDKADLFLVLLQLQKGEIPVCALAEVAWMGSANLPEGKLSAGMQFIGIVESDRKRIEDYVQKSLAVPKPK